MTLTQTVDIPLDRRLHLDLEIPREVPTGRTDVIIQFPLPHARKRMTEAEEIDAINRMVEIRKNEIMENMEYQAMFLEELEK